LFGGDATAARKGGAVETNTAVKEVFTPAELAIFIGCKRTKVYGLLRHKEIPSYKVGRLTRILRAHAERWREANKVR